MSDTINTFDEKKLNVLPIVVLDQPSKKIDEKEEKFLREYVICEFNNMENQTPGIIHTMLYGNTKKSMKLNFIHGLKYRIPRHIMNHINRCGTPQYKYKPNGDGAMVKAYAGRQNRFSMQQIG